MPVLNMEPDHIVPDELHLMLRGDILICNLINNVVATSLKLRKGAQNVRDCLNKVETAVSSFGITFKIWEERGADGKPSGTYSYTSIRGNDLAILLQHLPTTFADILEEEVQAITARIWIVRQKLYLINEYL